MLTRPCLYTKNTLVVYKCVFFYLRYNDIVTYLLLSLLHLDRVAFVAVFVLACNGRALLIVLVVLGLDDADS